jgi:predicted house-cleaning noncanonical NTP pyrophosphatase (MazG superfamily)
VRNPQKLEENPTQKSDLFLPNPFPKMKKFATNMLIRNNRLPLMQEKGIIINYEILSDENYIKELKQKLIEEAIEASETNTPEELKYELADVLEVIEHLIAVHVLDREEIRKTQEEKQKELGGFEKKIKTHYVEIAEESEEIAYYLARPNKYPEIK